ncbi:hypothetical protein OE749_05370 [Aestuariibacter sp. AA17]|uniref:Tc1-like transposase DDE domain-containing protein n=1 Tax=Fluctibacter corallii TaxID=2984329 RepID=A0ABT3A5Z9_9ALTE|nr:hypothetical protein [Aestuariibacter sp. AA17]MCV2884115.1 hypothetical protein [Aestuariibacter sp. AA17]
MASVYAIPSMANSGKRDVMSVHDNYDALVDKCISENKWLYVLSDSMTCHKSGKHIMHLQKPASHMVSSWLTRIITAQECGVLLVENLALNDVEKKRIQSLCEAYNVIVVNVVTSQVTRNNVVKGPWLN